MKLYKCQHDGKILTEKALKKGICGGHKLVRHDEPEKEIVYKVAISVPNEAHILPEAYENHRVVSFRLGGYETMWKYEKRNPRYEFYFFSTGRLLTQMAREKLVQVALQADMDYIIMYDDDMLLPGDMVLKMLEDMEAKPEIDILGTLAFMRNPPHYPVIYSTEEGYDPRHHTTYYLNQAVKNYPREKLVECDAVGFGAVCIKMAMIRKMKAPYFMSTTATGEDIMFCINAKAQAKARVFTDTRIKLGHISQPRIVDEQYFDQWVKEYHHELGDKVHKYAVDEHDITHKLLELDR